MFNRKYDISIHGINVEIYVENKDKQTNVSSGIFSFNEGWIKDPTNYEVPEIDKLALDRSVQKWEDRYFLLKQNPSVRKIEYFMDELYDFRLKSLQEDGEFGLGNLTFKEIRGLGYLDELRDLRDELISKDLSLESLNESEGTDLEIKIREIWKDSEPEMGILEYKDNQKDDLIFVEDDGSEINFNTFVKYNPEEQGDLMFTYMVHGGNNGQGE